MKDKLRNRSNHVRPHRCVLAAVLEYDPLPLLHQGLLPSLPNCCRQIDVPDSV